MKSVSLTRFGGPENLVDARVAPPCVGLREVLLRVRAVGFNPVDFQTRQLGFEDLQPPVVLGFEVAGVVEEVGSDVETLQPGDHVMAWLGGPSRAGGYAQYVAVPAAFVTRKPASLSFARAAAVPLAGLTALRTLRRGQLRSDKSLFVAGGAGGVGSWTILLAKAMGAKRIVTTAGSAESREYLCRCLQLTHDQVIDYSDLTRQELADAACAANYGERFDIAVDCVGHRMTSLCCDIVGFQGAVISLVNAPKDNSHPPELADEEALFRSSAAFHCELVFAQAEYGPPELYAPYAEQLAFLARLLAEGALGLPEVAIVGSLSAETVRAAHRMLETGHTRGKLVALVD